MRPNPIRIGSALTSGGGGAGAASVFVSVFSFCSVVVVVFVVIIFSINCCVIRFELRAGKPALLENYFAG
jgi:hypothetical protein